MRTICVVTGTRADYGCLRWVMEGIKKTPNLALQTIVTGAHLSPEFGFTYRDLIEDGFILDRKIEMLLSSDTAVGSTKSMGLALIGFAEAFSELKPDIIFILGDRFEAWCAAAAATIARIPIAHAHGGEATEGAFDEALRHSITKMSHLHFVAAKEYGRRVIQLGENPDRVFCVGALGLDNIKKIPLLGRLELEASLGFVLGPRNLLVTFHPVTLEAEGSTQQMAELLAALEALGPDTHLIFTMPNADPDGRALMDMVDDFVAKHPNARAYASLGTLRYLSCVLHVDAVVGNSSSGLIEVPAFGKGTVNIGDRQRGRLKADSVIDCMADRGSISQALQRIYSADFQTLLGSVNHPYGEGGASEKVVKILAEHPLESILKKTFHEMTG